MDVGETIRRFIQEELVFGSTKSLTNDTPLCDGILDSIGLIELVAFLEERFGIHIDDADLTSDNFRTVESIDRFIGNRTKTT
jgi:acyl carrier protein